MRPKVLKHFRSCSIAVLFNIVITVKHGFSCIDICSGLLKILISAFGIGFQQLPC